MSIEIYELLTNVPDYSGLHPHDLTRHILPTVRRCAVPDTRILWISWVWLSFKIRLPLFVEDASVRACLNEDSTQVAFAFHIRGSSEGVERSARFRLYFAVPDRYR